MPLELQSIRASEFIQVGAEGKFDLAASVALFSLEMKHLVRQLPGKMFVRISGGD